MRRKTYITSLFSSKIISVCLKKMYKINADGENHLKLPKSYLQLLVQLIVSVVTGTVEFDLYEHQNRVFDVRRRHLPIIA